MYGILIHMNDEHPVAPTSQLYHVARLGGTEKPWSGEYFDMHESGMYDCKVCGQRLFVSNTKLDSHVGPTGLQGWPAFEDAIPGSVEFKDDESIGMHRTEVLCSRCKSHLGHIFEDDTSTGKHYCINSVCLDFKKE